jgi:hypothetical protein
VPIAEGPCCTVVRTVATSQSAYDQGHGSSRGDTMTMEQVSGRDQHNLGDERDILTAHDRDSARFMLLDGAAASVEAKEMAASLALRLYEDAGSGKRGKPTQAFVEAVAAIVSDHLRNTARDARGWGYRSHGRDQFSDKRIGYRVFKQAFDGMVASRLLAEFRGHQQYVDFGGGKVRSWGKTTRSRATQDLLDLTASAGITPANHDDHFSIMPDEVKRVVKDPLEVRKGSIRVGAEKYKGYPLPLDLTDPRVVGLHARMVRLNTFFAKQAIGGLEHRGFRRIFNDGGDPGYGWNKGGRLSSVGADSYQNAKKAARAEMTINGEVVIELDITASHLTILHALSGVEFAPSAAYEVEGLPRDVVKSWVTMTLGHSRFHRRWPDGVIKRLEKTLGVELKTAYPIAKTREKIIDSIPLLRSWETSTVSWADLQFIEGCAIIETVETLAFEHDVPCLPVHDSIIVPASNVELAERVLTATFRKVVGVDPHLKRA